MTRQEIDAVFDRVKAWPHDRQEDAARTLMMLEQLDARSDELQRDLEEGEASGLASEEEVRAAFARFPRSAA